MRIDDAIFSGSVLGSRAVVSLTGSFTGHFNYNPSVKTTNFTAASGQAYIITSSTLPVTMSLPSSPSNGDSIKLANMDGRQTLIVRNGSKIMSDDEDMTLDIVASSFELMYESTIIGWTIIGSRSI